MTDATPVDHAPTRVSRGLAIVAGIGAVAFATIGGGGAGGGVALLGVVLVAFGATVGERWAVTAGSFVCFGGVLVAGLAGAPPAPIVAGTVAAVAAWDLGENAINLGEHVGRNTPTRRAELAHATATTGVGVVAATGGYLVYNSLTGSPASVAVILLLVGGVALVAALRP